MILYEKIDQNLEALKHLEKQGFTQVSTLIRKHELFTRYKELLDIEQGVYRRCADKLHQEFKYKKATIKRYISEMRSED